MSFSTVLQPRALKELLDAWIWYEEKQADLGDKFESEVYQRIEEIRQDPYRYRERKPWFYETKVKTFPYLIIYRIIEEKKLIVVSSIFNTNRNPGLKYRF